MAKIKKIKLGSTTYDLCDAAATHKVDGVTGSTVNHFGSCSTGATTAAKTVSITAGTFSLETGAKVTVKFTNKNTAETPTLNVNSTGAKNIFHNGAQITTGGNKSLLYGTVDFVYDGTQWQLIGNYVDTNTHNSHTLSSGTKANGTTEIVGASSSGKLTLGASGVTQGAYGPGTSENPASAGTITVPEITVNDKGIVVDATDHSLNLPSISIPNKSSSDTTDLVYAVSNLVESGVNGHTITPTYSGLPTKAYVDKVATGHVKYLGTATALTSLSTTAGQGDFYRVSTAFTFGSETAHIGDIILATKDNPAQNTTDWDLIHTEINTNTWTANTASNAGYVASGSGQAYKVWHTDAAGNPAWRSLGEANLAWGGRNFAGSWGPIDAAMVPQFAANRFAFLPASAITAEYSTNGGSSWTTTTSSNAKENIFAAGGSFYIGNNSDTGLDKSNYKCRITITTSGAVYSVLNKFAIRVSTNGSTGSHVKLESRTKANQDAGNNTWVTNVERAELSGWSGWNIINVSGITTHGNASSQYSQLRFTFGVDSHPSTSQYNGLQILSIMAFGGEGWTIPSNMAKNGHLYSYDATQKAIFPGDVTVASGKKFIGNLQGTASIASTVPQNVVDGSNVAHNLLLSTNNNTTTETGAINKATNLSFVPYSYSNCSPTKGVLTLGTSNGGDGYETGCGDVDSGELHIYGNIFAGAGQDDYGIYPERSNWSEVGGQYDNYWYKMHGSNYYGSNFYYKDSMSDEDSSGVELRNMFADISHTHTTSLATNTGTSSITLAHGSKYKLTAGGNSVIFTMPSDNNTTLSGIAYCTTAASTAAKTATMPGFALSSGQRIFLRTTATNSATSSVTLSVNSTTAKPVKIGDSSTAPTASNFPAGDYLANYDGTNWVLTRIYLTDTNTKNTAGSTNTSSKIYLIGATSQAANPQTYSHDTAYVDTDGCLYSGGSKVLTSYNNYYHTTGSWSGLTYTATANGGAGALAFTLPTGTTSTTVAAGNHTHTCSIKNSSGTAVTSLAHGTTYTLTAGDTSVNFTMPSQYSHPTTAGNKHIPSGGAATKMLKYSSSGTVTWDYIANVVYPVGSIYMSVTNTSPATLFGGTWVQLKDRFLLGAGATYSNTATGGSATHTLTQSELPYKQLGLMVPADRSGYSGTLTISTNQGSYTADFASGSGVKAPKVSLGTSASAGTIKTEYLGSGSAHNNMPPYLVVYMWKRTA